MPPALVPLALVAIGVPAGVRAAIGRPRGMAAAWLLSGAAVLVAQTLGELTGTRSGTLGEAQVLLAAIAAVFASLGVAALERIRG
ncbi:MAG TPA: hypothetical protein VF998_01290 [Candidatus Limnocylindria bacterium]